VVVTGHVLKPTEPLDREARRPFGTPFNGFLCVINLPGFGASALNLDEFLAHNMNCPAIAYAFFEYWSTFFFLSFYRKNPTEFVTNNAPMTKKYTHFSTKNILKYI
jgi:hypothetical protein